MDAQWQETFRARMRRFEARRPPQPGELSVSIKVRVVSGCFHREHSPRGYALIDQLLSSLSPSEPGFVFEEHESGPELLVYLALATAGVTLAKSIIDLVTAIIKARSEGVEKGDRPSDPVELIVRRTGEGSEFREEVVLRFGHSDPIDATVIEQSLNEALGKLVGTPTKNRRPGSPSRRPKPKRRRSGRRQS